MGRCARAIGTGERSNGEPLRVTSIFSLWASNSVPMPVIGKHNVRAGTVNERCDEHLELLMGEEPFG
jgi:hypothetical protein